MSESNQFKDYKYIFCSQHQETQLNMVCAIKNCIKFLEPYCSVCLEENSHKDKHNFEKNLKQALIELQQQVIDFRCEIDDENTQATQYQEQTSKKFSMLSEKISEISNLISKSVPKKFGQQRDADNEINKDFRKVEYALNTIEQNNKKNEVLIENLQKIKDSVQIDYSEKKIKVNPRKKDQYKKEFEIYQQQMQTKYNELDTLLNQIVQISNCDRNINVPEDALFWKFQKSHYSYSLDIQELKSGLVFKSSKGYQSIYSNEIFKTGEHGFIIDIEDFEEEKKEGEEDTPHFLITLLSTQFQDDCPAYSNFYKCLFCEEETNSIKSEPQKSNFKGILNPEYNRIIVKADFDKNIFEINDKDKKVVYSLEPTEDIVYDEQNNKDGYRFCLFWINSQIKITLKQAY